MASVETQETETTRPERPRVHWNADQLKSSYCNFCNANSTREEVVLNFGINNSWDRGQVDMQVDLTHRIVMSPFAAKRLSEVLANLVREYEARHGTLS
jgi:hypothetical protein